jgi:hypothetical protein
MKLDKNRTKAQAVSPLLPAIARKEGREKEKVNLTDRYDQLVSAKLDKVLDDPSMPVGFKNDGRLTLAAIGDKQSKHQKAS